MNMAVTKVNLMWGTCHNMNLIRAMQNTVLLQKSTPNRIELSIYSIQLALAVLLHLELVVPL